MPSYLIFFAFVLGLFASLVLIPSISQLAISIGIVDRPSFRSIHSRSVPRLGGIAIFFATTLSVLLFCQIEQDIKGYLAGGIIMFLTGLSDDLEEFSKRQKLMGEAVAITVAVIIGGQAIPTLGNLFGFGSVDLGYAAVPFTIFAMMGVANAVNLIDGLDGLAGGTAAIASLALLVLAFFADNHNVMFMAAALLGAALGFLKFNTHPARIFMGDSGSLFLGYSLSYLAINLVNEGGGVVSPVTPLIILAIPVADTLIVAAGRIRRGVPLWTPDATHLHHRLLAMGLSHRFTVAVLYGCSYIMATVAVIFHQLPDYLLFYGLLLSSGAWYVNLLLMERHYRQTGRLLFFSVRVPTISLRGNPHLHQFYISMLRLAKYLLVAVFAFAACTPPVLRGDLGLIAGFLLTLVLVLFMIPTPQGSRFLHVVIYFIGAFVIYLMENYSGGISCFGFPLLAVSDFIFGLLLVASLILAALRANPNVVISTPLEYLILFLVISTPLLPAPLRAQYHLLVVAAKSVILFVALKLVLKPWAHRNRKIILVTVATLFVVALRNLLSW